MVIGSFVWWLFPKEFIIFPWLFSSRVTSTVDLTCAKLLSGDGVASPAKALPDYSLALELLRRMRCFLPQPSDSFSFSIAEIFPSVNRSESCLMSFCLVVVPHKIPNHPLIRSPNGFLLGLIPGFGDFDPLLIPNSGL